jgi:hypothetical protein
MLQMFHISSISLVVFDPLFDCHIFPINFFVVSIVITMTSLLAIKIGLAFTLQTQP